MIWLDCISRAYTVMQLISLYRFSSASICVHLLYIFKWNGSVMVFSMILLKMWGDFTEKVKIAMLMALSIECKRSVHLSVLSLKIFIHLISIYHEKGSSFTSWWEIVFPPHWRRGIVVWFNTFRNHKSLQSVVVLVFCFWFAWSRVKELKGNSFKAP